MLAPVGDGVPLARREFVGVFTDGKGERDFPAGDEGGVLVEIDRERGPGGDGRAGAEALRGTLAGARGR